MKVGFIGAGAVAKSHIAALRCLEDVRVAAVHDPVRQRAAYLARPWGACAPVEEVTDGR